MQSLILIPRKVSLALLKGSEVDAQQFTRSELRSHRAHWAPARVPVISGWRHVASLVSIACLICLLVLQACPGLAQVLDHESACKSSGQQDVFVLLDISLSMFQKNLVPSCVEFVKSKLAEMNAGRIDVVAFSQGWVQLHPKLDADFHVLIRPDDPNARARLLSYLDPGTFGPLTEDRNWRGFVAAAGNKRGGTDIGLAVHRALTDLEQRISDPVYLKSRSGLQLWVLTDSEEESKSHKLAELLKRMQLLRTNLWFQYHEIVLLNPAKLSSAIRLRHSAITNAGFAVDFTQNLKERIRIPSPWPAGSGQAGSIVGSCQIPCLTTPGDYEIQLETALVFDTCGERGERVPGKFKLNAKPQSLPIPNITLLMPQEVDAELFGKPIRNLRLKADWNTLPPGNSSEAIWSLDYSFVPAEPYGGAIVDYLAQPQTLVRLRLQRPSSPEIQWKILGDNAATKTCFAPNAVVARIRLSSTNLAAPTSVNVSLASAPPGALLLDVTNLTISAVNSTASLNIIAGDTDATNASSTLSLHASPSGDCPVLVSPVEQKVTACFISPQIHWQVIALTGTKRVSQGDMVGQVVVTPTNIMTPTEIVVEITSEPSEALGFGTNVSKTSFTLNPGSPSHVLRVFAGKTDAAAAKAELRLRGSVASGRSPLIIPAQETISAHFVQSARLEWIAAGGRRIPAPSVVSLRATRDKDGVWKYEKPVPGEPTEQFLLTLPEPGDEQSAFQVSIEAGDLKYAVDLQEEGQQRAGPARKMGVSTQGSHVFRLATKPTDDSRYYRGKLEVTPPQGQFLNGTNKPIFVPIEVYFTPPPKTNQ